MTNTQNCGKFYNVTCGWYFRLSVTQRNQEMEMERDMQDILNHMVTRKKHKCPAVTQPRSSRQSTEHLLRTGSEYGRQELRYREGKRMREDIGFELLEDENLGALCSLIRHERRREEHELAKDLS